MTETEAREWLERELSVDWILKQAPIDRAVYATVMDCKTLYARLLESKTRMECVMAINDFEAALRHRLRGLTDSTACGHSASPAEK